MRAGMHAPTPQSPTWLQVPHEPDNLQLILEKAHDISFGSVVSVEPVSDASSCSRSSVSMDHQSGCGADSPAYVSASTAASSALFHRLSADVIYHILVVSDPPTFTSLTLLNRRWRRQSNISALYYLQLLKLFPFSTGPGRGHALNVDPFSNLSNLKRALARQARRGLWSSCIPGQRLHDLNIVTTHQDSNIDDFPLACASTRSSRVAILYSASSAFVFDFHRGTPLVKYQIAIEDDIQTVALSRDSKSIVLATHDGALRLDRLENDGLYPILSMRLYGSATAVAVTSRASVIAVAYKSHIEITTFRGSVRTKRILACAFVEHLEFSEDGKLLLATTTTGSCTTVAKLDSPITLQADVGSLEAAWSSQPISLTAFQNCTHAVFLPSKDASGQELVFGREKTANSFGVFNVANLSFKRVIVHESATAPPIGVLQWQMPTVSNDGLEIAIASSDHRVSLFRKTLEMPHFDGDSARTSLQHRGQSHGDLTASYELVRSIDSRQDCGTVRWVRSSKRESLAFFPSILSYFGPDAGDAKSRKGRIVLVDFGLSVARMRSMLATIELNVEAHNIPRHAVDPAEPGPNIESAPLTQLSGSTTHPDQDSDIDMPVPCVARETSSLDSRTAAGPSNIDYEFGATSVEQEAAVSKALDSMYELDSTPLTRPAFVPDDQDSFVSPVNCGPLLNQAHRSSTRQSLRWRPKWATSNLDTRQGHSELPLAETAALPNEEHLMSLRDPPLAADKGLYSLRTESTQTSASYVAALSDTSTSPKLNRKAKRQSWHPRTTNSEEKDESSYFECSPDDEAALSPTISQTGDRSRRASRRFSGLASLSFSKVAIDAPEPKPASIRAPSGSPPLTYSFPSSNSELADKHHMRGFEVSIPSPDQQASLRRRHLASTQDRISLSSHPIGYAPRAARGAHQPSYLDHSFRDNDSHSNSMASQRSGYSTYVTPRLGQTQALNPPTSNEVPAPRLSTALMPTSIPEEGQQHSMDHVESRTPHSPDTSVVNEDVAVADEIAVSDEKSTPSDISQTHELLAQTVALGNGSKLERRRSSMLRMLKFDGFRNRGLVY